MAEGDKISALPLADSLTGAEQIPFAKTGANGRLTVEQLKGYVTDGIDLSGLTAYDDTEIKGRVSDLEQAVQTNADAIAANLDNIEQAQAEIEANQERISENLAKIEQANADKAEHEANAWSIINSNTAKTKENEDAIATKANAADVYDKATIDALVETMTENVREIKDINASDDLRLKALESFPHDRFLTADQLPTTDHLATKEELEAKFNELLGTDSTTLENIEKLSQMLQEGDENTVAALNTMLNDYYTKSECDDKYVSKVEHDDANWAEKSWCSENFETKSDAANTYAPIADYALKEDLSGLAKTSDIPEFEPLSEDEIRQMYNAAEEIATISEDEL